MCAGQAGTMQSSERTDLCPKRSISVPPTAANGALISTNPQINQATSS